LHRFHIFLIAENDFRLFPMTKGAAKLREKRRRQVERYMREAGPEKYHELLIPDFDVGCKVYLFILSCLDLSIKLGTGANPNLRDGYSTLVTLNHYTVIRSS